MNATPHAQIRCQQRGIPSIVVGWLMKYGAVKHAHGARKRFFDKRARQRLVRAVGYDVVRRHNGLLNTYIVEVDERLLTVGHRTRRIKR